MDILLVIFYIVTFMLLTVGALGLMYYPLAILFELRPSHEPVFDTATPLVSIIVPAYNEEKVIGSCIESIQSSDYPNFEIILVDDGSTDQTLEVMRRFENPPRVQVITQPNTGKASALNRGFQLAKGEILFFVDADGLFTSSTIREMLAGFSSEKVGAVCGNDHPANMDTALTQFASLQNHVGSGFVRRALAEINCLPIIAGNCGAVRRSVLKWPFTRLGKEGEPYINGFIGEDMELTWRIHRAGYQVNFAPRAIVRAEVPSTITMLWKQRVRWTRGLLQTIGLHRDMLFNFKYGRLGLYLPINFFNMVISPILQLLIIYLMILFVATGFSPIQPGMLNPILWLGLGGALFTLYFAIVLDWAWADLKYFYVIPLWVPYSLMLNLVTIWAVILELWGTGAKWDKFERTGVMSEGPPLKNAREE